MGVRRRSNKSRKARGPAGRGKAGRVPKSRAVGPSQDAATKQPILTESGIEKAAQATGVRKASASGSKSRGVRRRKREPETVDGFEALAKTTVYRKLSTELRASLDTLLLLRPEECPTIEDAYRKLGLGEKFGLEVADIRRYAEVLEAFTRPFMASLAVSSLLKALPKRLASGFTQVNRLVVWSRLVQQLTDAEAPPLYAGEFARLSEMLGNSRRRYPAASAEGAVRLGMSRYWRGEPGKISVEELAAASQATFGVNLAPDIGAKKKAKGDVVDARDAPAAEAGLGDVTGAAPDCR